MKRRTLLMLATATLAASACSRGRPSGMAGPGDGSATTGGSRFSRSRFNPRNWFGRSREVARPDLGPTLNQDDNRPLIVSVTELAIERTSSGALIRAEGLTRSAGWWDVELIAENAGRPVDGVLTFRFVAAAPREDVPLINDRARTVVAAAPIPEATLEQISAVVVVAETNSRRSRR